MRRLRACVAGAVVCAALVVVMAASAGRSSSGVSVTLKPGSTVAQAVALPSGASGLSESVTVSGVLTQTGGPFGTKCYDAFYYNSCSFQGGNGVVNSIWLVPPGWNGSASTVVLLSSLIYPAGPYPSFSSGHVYNLTLNLAGRQGWSLFAAATIRGGTLADWSGSFTVTFNNVSAPTSASTAAVSSFAGDVTVIHADGSREQIGVGTLLRKGDQIQTGVDAHVVLRFADGTIMDMSEMTQLLVVDLLNRGTREAVQVALKLGEVSAQVNPKKAFQTDFKVVTPGGVTSVRGTKFSVFYNASSRTTIVRTQVHEVVFTPSRGGKTVLVPAGKEIQATPSGVSPLAPIGKAGARGGVDMQTALDRVLAVINRATTHCGLSAPTGGVSMQPAGATGWKVTVTFPSKTAGSSSWTVTNGKVIAVNALAKTIASGCPAPPQTKAKPGHYTGQDSANNPVSFDVTPDSPNVTNINIAGHVTCTDNSGWTWTITSNANNPINSSLAFTRSYSGGLTASDSSISNINVTYTMTGTLTTTGTASGTFQINHISWDQSGTHYDCTGTAASWTARLSG